MKLTERMMKFGMAAFTVTAAAGIGFFMQSGSPLEASAVKAPKPKVVASALSLGATDAVVDLGPQPMLPNAVQYADAQLPAQPIVLAVATDTPTIDMPAEESVPMLGCEISVSAIPAVAALVNLSVQASCFPDSRISVAHAGMTFTELLDQDGMLEISVPVMEETAQFEVTLPNGKIERTSVDVPSLQFYDRVALQWMGESGLQIHAREFGAEYGTDGHVWFGNDRDLMVVVGGEGGFLLRLGEGQSEISQMADVYTFPSASAATSGDILLTVEAEVSGANCGKLIKANALQVAGGGDVTSRQLEVEIPDCAATGDFLVLKNLLQDLKIAAN